MSGLLAYCILGSSLTLGEGRAFLVASLFSSNPSIHSIITRNSSGVRQCLSQLRFRRDTSLMNVFLGLFVRHSTFFFPFFNWIFWGDPGSQNHTVYNSMKHHLHTELWAHCSKQSRSLSIFPPPTLPTSTCPPLPIPSGYHHAVVLAQSRHFFHPAL